jgi:hypothetical protein
MSCRKPCLFVLSVIEVSGRPALQSFIISSQPVHIVLLFLYQRQGRQSLVDIKNFLISDL